MSGVTMGHHRVRRLVQANGLRPVGRRKFVHTTDSEHTMHHARVTQRAGPPV